MCNEGTFRAVTAQNSLSQGRRPFVSFVQLSKNLTTHLFALILLLLPDPQQLLNLLQCPPNPLSLHLKSKPTNPFNTFWTCGSTIGSGLALPSRADSPPLYLQGNNGPSMSTLTLQRSTLSRACRCFSLTSLSLTVFLLTLYPAPHMCISCDHIVSMPAPHTQHRRNSKCDCLQPPTQPEAPHRVQRAQESWRSSSGPQDTYITLPLRH